MDMPSPVSAPNPPAVCLQRISRRFGEHQVLDELSLEIAPGEFVALLGASGSGKTTLLRALAGLDRIDGGELHAPAATATVFQEPRLMPWKRVRHNVALGVRRADAHQLALQALDEVGLSHRIDAYPATLSGGEAQRAALARGLVREPELFLLDEPFAALDALTRIRMHALLLELWRKHRPAVLLVTHDINEAILLADRVLVLVQGRIAEDVPVPWPRPRHQGEARFDTLRRHFLSLLGVPEADGAEHESADGADRRPHNTQET
ncbi:ABC transporter ATP-binding protein [Pseudothauera rhizosphaerae]|uniref:ABC transporter ATP-binding protein n=1 Tax=Pseudothauera rhizosphaerae TaxID=2565932 RepID=A0A4S4AVX5_9RHOO|nr:ABC transporter ATP-binding protein [Pseudothauera rhizosphaerae]THF62726.1 ABC transporter ATP-binding protein [Pseudothauera rhizosphaerae]